MDRSAPSDTALGDLSVMALANEELRGAEAGDLSVAAAGPVAYGAAVADGLEPLVCDESFLQERLFLSTLDSCNKAKDSVGASSRLLLFRWSLLPEDSRAGPKGSFSSNNEVTACSLTYHLSNRSTPCQGWVTTPDNVPQGERQ